MRKTDDVFSKAKEIKKSYTKNVDFSCWFSWRNYKWKNGYGHFSMATPPVVGTHTHIPTADTRILDKGTAYQTDIGMCGDYNSVIGMNKENSLKRFFKDKEAVKHFPSEGEGTLSGIIVDADETTGLAKKVKRLIIGGSLEQ